jgi:hypothetical protein
LWSASFPEGREAEEAARKEAEAIEAAYGRERHVDQHGRGWNPEKGRMMQPRPKRNNPPEGAPRAREALAHAASMVAQATRRETALEDHQRKFVRESLKRAVREMSCLLRSAWLGGGATPREREALHFDAPMRPRGASHGLSSLHLSSPSTG